MAHCCHSPHFMAKRDATNTSEDAHRSRDRSQERYLLQEVQEEKRRRAEKAEAQRATAPRGAQKESGHPAVSRPRRSDSVAGHLCWHFSRHRTSTEHLHSSHEYLGMTFHFRSRSHGAGSGALCVGFHHSHDQNWRFDEGVAHGSVWPCQGTQRCQRPSPSTLPETYRRIFDSNAGRMAPGTLHERRFLSLRLLE